AHHCARAAVPGEQATAARALDYAARAGDRALAQLAHDEAVAYYRQALQLCDDAAGSGVALGDDEERRRLELLIALGNAQRRAGDPDHRETLLDAADRARRRGDADALARAALASAIADPATLFYVLVARFMAINSPATLGQRLADTAELLALVDTIDDPQARFLAHFLRSRVSLEAADLDTARVHADAGLAVAD